MIYKVGATYKWRQIYHDGSRSDHALTKKGNKFTCPNDYGEYVKIETNGSLSWYDESGKISTLKRIK